MALAINIEKLIAGNIIESDRIEFKAGWNPLSILHSICAFANDFNNIGGGYIIVGIEEENGQAVQPPTGIPVNQLDKIQKKLLNLCHQITPNYFPIAEPYKMGIARGPKESIRPLKVGLLMFNEEPQKFFRGAKIEVIDYHDEIGDSFSEHIFTGTIQSQLKETLLFIKNSYIKEEVRKIDGQAEAHRFYNYPYEAIEEALANAIYHKSYDRQNPVEVNIRPDCIEILSFAGPLPPVDNMMLKKQRIVARDYRNSRIGDFLKELDLTEGRGTGIPKIRFSMKTNGSPEPIFETDTNNTYFLTTLLLHKDVTLKLSGTKSATKSATAQSTAQGTAQATAQATAQVTAQVIHFCLTPKSAKEIMSELKLKHWKTFQQNYLLPLLNANFLERTIPDKPKSRLQKYRLAEKGIMLLESQKKASKK